ncbi:MAG: hypothetical protein ABTQ31_05725 [Rhizobiaceae bacterium]|jgi:hypothetical protein
MIITSEMVIFVIAIVSAIAGLWWRVEAAIGASKKDAILQAQAASALASLASTQLAEHKLHVAETYITKAGLRETTEQLMGAVAGVKASVDQMNQRMDRVIESQHVKPKPGGVQR